MRLREKRAWLFAAAILLAGVPAAEAQPGPRDITVALAAELNNGDPCNISTAYVGNVFRQNVVETLTYLDPKDSSVQPRLATAWEQTAPGTFRFTLRQGVKFHDGSAFNAESAAQAINRMENPNLPCMDRNKRGDSKFIPTAVDEYTLEIASDPPRTLIPLIVSMMGISAPGTGEAELIRNPVGTGPFLLKEWTGGGEIHLQRFEGYWGEKPEVERVTYVTRNESALRAAMVSVGEADLALDVAPQDATDPAMDKSFLSGETTRIRMVLQPPLDDIRVRKALNLAFDRDALIGTLLSKDVVPATHFFLPKIAGYNHDLAVWPYDPAEAKRLIDEARADGVPVDQELRLIGRTGFYANQEEVLQTLSQMWASIGIKTKLEMMESGQFLKLVNKPYDGERPAMLIQEQHDNNTGDAESTMFNRYTCGGRQSETCDPEVDRLIDEARNASGDERRSLFAQANRILAEDIVPAIPMYYMASYVRVGPRVELDTTGIFSGLIEISKVRFKDGD